MQLISLFLISLTVVSSQDWGYNGNDGPDNWGNSYPKCKGLQQSPIDIGKQIARKTICNRVNYVNFNRNSPAQLTNVGSTALLEVQNIGLNGGVLFGNYIMTNANFHWGRNDEEGSEHTLDGEQYPLEMEIVFYKESYGSLVNATKFSDGLAVLSYLFQISSMANRDLSDIIDALGAIQEYGATTSISSINLQRITRNLQVQDYAHYIGSMTTPPCMEVIEWFISSSTIPISSDQMAAFRRLQNSDGELITNNFRPTQPLNGRSVVRIYNN